jgi:hypothetical protein
VDPQNRQVVVSKRIKEEFENGKDYYNLEAGRYGSQWSRGRDLQRKIWNTTPIQFFDD